MKKIILLASFSLVLQSSLYAQTSPRVLSYQGAIRSASNVAGNHSMTVTLYGDANGTVKLWQSTMNAQIDSTGVFNCLLGSAANLLPDVSVMDRPMWLGVSIDGTAELRPLSEVTASAYALNVADSSISTNKLLDHSVTTNKLSDQSVTTAKIADQAVSTSKLADSSVTASKLNLNYISSISVNGQPITGQGKNLNIVSGDGVNVFWDQTEGTLMFSGIGTNSGTGKGTGFHTLSIHDTIAFWNGTIFHPGPSGAANLVLHGDGGSAPTWDSVSLVTDVSGLLGYAHGGTLGIPHWSSLFAGGGNNATDYSSVVAGGAAGDADNYAATVGGGFHNRAYGDDAVVAGGEANQVGVDTVDPNSYHSAIGGGADNSAFGIGTAIPGGVSLTLGSHSFGFNGDSDLHTRDDHGDADIPLVAAVTDLSSTGANMQQVAYFGNVNVMIGNVDNAARQVQFYSPNNHYNYSGSKYSSFQAGTQTANINYTLPQTIPVPGQFLKANTVAGTNVGLIWDTVTGGGGGGGDSLAWLINGNTGTVPPTNFLGTIDSQIFEIHVHNGAATSTGGNKRVMQYSEGPLSPDILGGSSANFLFGERYSGAAILSGGGLLGPNQLYANFSTIVGGAGNLIDDGSGYTSGGFDFIGSGADDTIDDFYGWEISWYDVISGGDANRIHSSWSSTISGGQGNVIDSLAIESTIAGGNNNYIGKGAQRVVISGGSTNKAYDSYTIISGGTQNTINLGSPYASILGGDMNQISTKSSSYGFIIGARGAGGGWTVGNYTAGYQTISGGLQNTLLSTADVIAGGVWNHIDTNSVVGTISGGGQDTIQAPLGTIGGGSNNHITSGGVAATIPGGFGLIAQSQAQFVTGEYNIAEGSIVPDTDDDLAIFGNGIGNTARSNAYDIKIGGYSSAYDNIGSGHSPTNPTRMGSTYADNTIEAWGNVAAHDSIVTSDIGILSVTDTSGVYTIVLNVKNQDGSVHTFTPGNCAIVVTPITNPTGGGPGIANATPVDSTGTFRVTTWAAGSPIPNDGFGFMFHVVLK